MFRTFRYTNSARLVIWLFFIVLQQSYCKNIYISSGPQFAFDSTTELQTGKILDTVKCTNKPGESYALYLPTYYIPLKKLPVVYIFDPAARGTVPIGLMKEAAEKYGYIIAASNNSRNGLFEPQVKSAQAMVEDTHLKLAINDSCLYFAGFSGGARLAAWLAGTCNCSQGVLLNSAGFSGVLQPSSDNNQFAVFTLAGYIDFNYDEMVSLDKTLDTLKYLHFFRRFNGTHQWAPKEYWLEGFAWMKLIAMKNGRQSRDTEFIDSELALSLKRAQAQEDSGNIFYAWKDYQNARNIFQGLTDTRQIEEYIASLEKNKKLLEQQEQEEDEVKEQVKMQSQVLAWAQLISKPKPKWLEGEQLNNYYENGYTVRDIKVYAFDAIKKFNSNLRREDLPEKRRVLERARNVIALYLGETAQHEMDSNNLQVARILLEFAIELQPAIFMPHVSLARCLIRMDEKSEAIKELSKAQKLGLSSKNLAELSKQYSELNSLKDNQDFQKLIAN